MSAATQTPGMTVPEFLAWTPPGSDRWELIDGTPLAMAPASPRHGAIAAQAARLLGNHLDQHPQCRVVIEPGVQPRVRGAINVRVPDLGVTCGTIAPEDRLLRAPVLLIEVLSPSNAADTWGNVWSYTTIPSLREILVLHTAAVRGELLARQPDDTWPADPLVLRDTEVLTLACIGLSTPLADFYRTAGLEPGA